MCIAYYVVESERLSRNPAVTRILLATADTLLEVAGENAPLFLSNPRLQALVGTLIEEFAGKRNFDDESAATIFKTLLGSTIVAVAENPGKLAEESALKPLFAALGNVRDQLGDDFVARIISTAGFERLLASYASQVAADPAFLTQNELAQKAITAMLQEVGQHLPQLIDDPKALFGVLEVGLTTVVTNAPGVFERELGNKPMLVAVLSALTESIASTGQQQQLFASIMQGQGVAWLYKAVLQAILASPQTLFGEGKTEQFLAQLVSGLATSLSQVPLSQAFTTETLQVLVARSLEELSQHPELLAQHNQFVTQLLAAVLQASATVIGDGLRPDDVLPVVSAALKTTSEHIALTGMEDRFGAVIAAISASLAHENFRALLTPQGRQAALIAALQAVAANPVVWSSFAARPFLQPLVQSIFQGLATDPSHLLSGPVLVQSLQNILLATARRGHTLSEQQVQPEALQQLLTLALVRASQEIGISIDSKNLSQYLERIVSSYLKAPFPLTAGGDAAFGTLAVTVLATLDAA
jgi:hypothetical protein